MVDRRQPSNIQRLHRLGDSYHVALAAARDLSAEIERQIEEAEAAGQSLMDVSKASGLSLEEIDYIRASVHVQNLISNQRGYGDLRFTA